jgi:rhamnosyltransferase
MKNNNSVLCIIVSYNGADKLSKTVKALVDQVEDILIIDNGSQQETIDLIMSMHKNLNIKYDLLQSNKGIGFALNKGVLQAKVLRYSWILTMDQDSVANDDMVEELLASAERQKKMCAVSPMIFENNNNAGIKDEIIQYAITSGNLVPTKVFDMVGHYNEDYFIDSVDFEFCLRIKNANLLLVQSKKARLVHELGNLIKKRILWLNVNYIEHTPVRRYYIYRNHLYLSQKYLFKNPQFVIKKSAYLLFYTLNIVMLDDKRIENIKMIALGISDYFKGVVGPLTRH